MLNIKKNRLIAYLKLSISAVIWGISFIATKVAVAEAPPAVIIWLRFNMSLVILFFYLLQRRELTLPPIKELLYLALLGFIGISLHHWLQSTGLVTAKASTTSWLIATTPIFMALLAWLFLKEKITLTALCGILLASMGVLLVVSNGDMTAVLNGEFGSIGNVLVMLSAFNWAVFSVLSRRSLDKYSAIFVLFYATLFGVLFSSVHFLFIKGWIYIPQLSNAAWLAIAFLGVASSFLAYTYWYDGLQIIGATQAGVFIYMEPLISLVVAALVLNEAVTLPALLGGSLILLGVWLVNRM
jgi:drug/metabolite transporter (DMT)-like permease